MGSGSGLPGWVIPLIIIGGLIVVAAVIALLWVRSRAKFIFTDCIVRNRGAIAEPWREFRKEGNSLFLFSLAVGLAILLFCGVVGLPLLLPAVLHGDDPRGAGFVIGVALFGLVSAVLLIAWAVISNFMIPVMYRRRCNAMEGFRGAWELVVTEPGPVILFILFSVVLWIAFAVSGCLLTCVTCCITAIPYVGTVILLPVHVFLMSYLLLFVRQFGPDYDGWANLVTATLDAPPIEASPAAPASSDDLPPLQL